MTVTHAVLERTDHGRFGDHEFNQPVDLDEPDAHATIAFRFALHFTDPALVGDPAFINRVSLLYAHGARLVPGYEGPIADMPDLETARRARVSVVKLVSHRAMYARAGYLRHHPGVGWELPYHEDMRRRWQQEAHDRSPESRLRIPTHVDANVDQWVSLHLPAGFRPTFTGGARCRACGQSKPDDGDAYVVYRDGHVKIGVSSNVRRRFQSLRSKPDRWAYPECVDPYQPLLGLGIISGNVEHALHEHFITQHAAGEWFRLEGELLQWLNEHAGASDPGPREEEPEWDAHVAVAPI